MAEPFIGEIKITGFNFPPKGWAACNGQIMSIQQNVALFSLLGTTYGGDGIRTFGLPNLQGRVPLHRDGAGPYPQGSSAGEASHTLTTSEIPAHTHTLSVVKTQGNQPQPQGNLLAAAPTGLGDVYGPNAHLTPMLPLGSTGGQAHLNLQPYLVLNFVIALQGIFPSRN